MRPRLVEFAFCIHARPDAVTFARHLFGQVIELVDADPVAIDACLITSELVANAVRHSHEEISVRFVIDADRLYIEVNDDARGEPQVEDPDPDSEGGRGLLIVSRLAAAWGWNRVSSGKSVWAELPIASPSTVLA